MTWYSVVIDGDTYTDRFVDVQVTGRENGVSSAILLADNKQGEFWTDTVDVFDDVTVQMRQLGVGGALTTIFTGTVREVKPYAAEGGFYTGVKCKGLGAALEETHCKDMFGYTSNQPLLYTIKDILEDLVDNSVNKSYSSANTTGYAITKTYIPAIDAGLSIPFLNAPYQSCKSVVDLICTLDTAYRDGATAGPHYFVDVLGNLRIKTIGTQQVEIGAGGDWGIYYNGAATNAAAKLYEAIDFYDYTLTKPTDAYANSVALAFDLRKPAYDYWTEYNGDGGDPDGGSTLWGKTANITLTNDSGVGPPPDFVVGTNSLNIETAVGAGGYTYFPSTEDAGWDMTKWGSSKTIPTLNFYMKKDGNLDESISYLTLFSTSHDPGVDADFFHIPFTTWGEGDDTWYYKSIPIGPYWANAEESKTYKWTNNDGNAVWSNIEGVNFTTVSTGGGASHLWIDDLHFSGKCVREAVALGGEVDPDPHPNNQYQHAMLSRTPLDDTAVAADDTGMAGQLCHAELLRRVTPPRTFTCTVPYLPNLKPGELFTLYAGRTTAGAYKLNGEDFRVTEYTHRCTMGAQPQTTLTLTDDVLNSFPLGRVDARAVLNEYLLENNSKATDMQGGDVDLLIPHLRKTY
jgi:hypothetical protein